MSEILVVIEDGAIKEVVSDDEDLIAHVVLREKTKMDNETTVTVSQIESMETSKVVDEQFNLEDYVGKCYGLKLPEPK